MRPEDLLDDLPPPDVEAKVTIATRRYGKKVTVVEGLDPRATDLDALTKELKNHIAAGGTHKEGRIELQGDQKARVMDFLSKRGFRVQD